MAGERFNLINYSDSTKFEGDSTGRIQLKSYSSDLLLYADLDSSANASYAYGTSTAVTGDTIAIENFGVFGQYAWIKNAGYIKYNSDNFEGLTTEGSIAFRMRAGFNNDPGYHTFSATTDPTIAGDTDYTFRLYVEDDLFSGGDTSVSLEVGDSLLTIANKISVVIASSDASCAIDGDSKIRITADNDGDSIFISAPSSGNSLLTLLSGVDTPAMPNAPDTSTEFLKLGGSGDSNKISLTHNTSSHLILNSFDADGDTIVYSDLGLWSNYYNEWYAFELNWNASILQLFIDGSMFSLKQFDTREGGVPLTLASTSGNSYRFDEVIVRDEYQNTKTYTPGDTALSQYDDTDPYADIYFGDGFVEGEVVDLNLSCHASCSFCVKIGNTWYYYYSGAWRVSNATYSQSCTPGEMETQFADLAFNENAELIIRVFFHSDGATQVWIDDIDIVVETGAAETATITGSVALSSTVNLSSLYNVTITTDQGDTTVNLKSGAGDTTAVTLDEIKTAIDNANVPGLANAGDDGSYHLVLQTTTTGDAASIEIGSGATNDALALVWGYAATDEGAAAVGSVVDYSEMFRYVRAHLGEPLIPVELTDEQLEDCISDAVWHYNRWRNFEEELLYTRLTGNPINGYDIPAVVGGDENIIEIMLHPRFPFTYYAGKSDLMSNLYVQFLFQKYTTGFSQMLTDYFITISMEDDISMILGTQIKWEILNDKLFIIPEPDNMDIAIRYRGALTAAEVVTNQFIKRLTLAEAKIVLGNVRSTFKSGIPGGAEMLQLNGEDLKQEGLQEKEQIIQDMKLNTEPAIFTWF